MVSQMSHIMTLANSIIGVSVLAMPFCFKQCGIILATLILLTSKFLVELFIIGYLLGTCIAFFVVMGDLGPHIVGKLIERDPEHIRTSLLITTSIFLVLPLGLLRNIDSLSNLCTATIIFYLCLVMKIVTESVQHIFARDWVDHVHYWKPSGMLQCIPIFSMALFCQTQLFEIYETIPNVSLEKMNKVVRRALNICMIVYLCVGFFGYIAFCTQPFTGNILMSLEPSVSSEVIKMGFVFSIAFSFPLVIFPCRASLNSLLFRKVYTHEPSTNYLPETRFRCLTVTIVAVSLITGIIIPNIEFVLSLLGSTIGIMICLIFPAVFFISINSKHTSERLLAQVILFIGICIMILSTYANLTASPIIDENVDNHPVEIDEYFMDGQRANSLLDFDTIKKGKGLEVGADDGGGSEVNVLPVEAYEKQTRMENQETEKSVARVGKNVTIGQDNGQENGYLKERKAVVQSVDTHSDEKANNKTLSPSKLEMRKIKITESRANRSKEFLKGPILNALTKRTFEQPVHLNNEKKNVTKHKQGYRATVASNFKSRINQITRMAEHSAALGLKAQNHTYDGNGMVLAIHNTTEENIPIIRRDILAHSQKTQGDTSMQTEETSAKVAGDNSNSRSNNTGNRREFVARDVSIKDEG